MTLSCRVQLIFQRESNLHETLQCGKRVLDCLLQWQQCWRFPPFSWYITAYPFSHKNDENLDSLSFTSSRKPAVRSVVWRQAVSTHSQRHCNRSRDLLYDCFTLASMPLSFFHPLTRQTPLAVSVNVSVSETPPQHHPPTTLHGLFHSALRSWASLRKQWEPSAVKKIWHTRPQAIVQVSHKRQSRCPWTRKKNKMQICIYFSCTLSFKSTMTLLSMCPGQNKPKWMLWSCRKFEQADNSISGLDIFLADNIFKLQNAIKKIPW